MLHLPSLTGLWHPRRRAEHRRTVPRPVVRTPDVHVQRGSVSSWTVDNAGPALAPRAVEWGPTEAGRMRIVGVYPTPEDWAAEEANRAAYVAEFGPVHESTEPAPDYDAMLAAMRGLDAYASALDLVATAIAGGADLAEVAAFIGHAVAGGLASGPAGEATVLQTVRTVTALSDELAAQVRS